MRNIHLGAAIVGIYRQDIYEIPPDAIRELIINAMVHRSYLDHGTIQVAVYDNRKEHLLSEGADEEHMIEIAFDSFENKRLRDPDVLYPHLKERIKDNGMSNVYLAEKLEREYAEKSDRKN